MTVPGLGLVKVRINVGIHMLQSSLISFGIEICYLVNDMLYMCIKMNPSRKFF